MTVADTLPIHWNSIHFFCDASWDAEEADVYYQRALEVLYQQFGKVLPLNKYDQSAMLLPETERAWRELEQSVARIKKWRPKN